MQIPIPKRIRFAKLREKKKPERKRRGSARNRITVATVETPLLSQGGT
jgi:hypothetical protein